MGVIEQKTNGLIAKYDQMQKQEDRVEVAVQNKENIDNNKKQTKKIGTQLDDKQAEAASLGVGIGAAALQPLVPTPASIFDDFSDEEDENNDDDNQMMNQQPQQ